MRSAFLRASSRLEAKADFSVSPSSPLTCSGGFSVASPPLDQGSRPLTVAEVAQYRLLRDRPAPDVFLVDRAANNGWGRGRCKRVAVVDGWTKRVYDVEGVLALVRIDNEREMQAM